MWLPDFWQRPTSLYPPADPLRAGSVSFYTVPALSPITRQRGPLQLRRSLSCELGFGPTISPAPGSPMGFCAAEALPPAANKLAGLLLLQSKARSQQPKG